ncbi:hypothetical protein GCM10010329_81550 [Streptomyces spiroverticillatus]|uniref:Uncharacterized protein n=1 Tax=Streptomyces finlayi TaxID=67296 RepID=A0A918X737_9ACTN|nr:hypothetical protein [Streptomyces finlayi]GHA46598.1 hypothetical protein GCM10010329_81550 [Streptomyces spiroverticillatus]GHD16163.1 hypothetical protein GCM10010334_76960 [Streptomyces finlayi]
MSVHITRPTSTSAEIAWEPGDDPQGFLVQAIDQDRLAWALDALADPAGGLPETPDAALTAAHHTTALAKDLKRRAAVQVVRLRDDHGHSWRAIAKAVLGDADKHQAVRRMYDSGHRPADD